jgi:SOS-response transcriptional repressor LexA
MKTLQKILSCLMAELEITLEQLSKHTGVPISSIDRIRSDVHANPTLSTLIPLAKYFGVTLGQLVGLEPISNDRIIAEYKIDTLKIDKIPLIKQKDVLPYLNNNKITINAYTYSEKLISEKSFAIKIEDDSMHPIFPKGIIVTFDPLKEYEDRDFVLVQLSENDIPVFKQIYFGAEEQYLVSLDKNIRSIPVTTNIRILAIAVEAHLNIEKEHKFAR